VVRPISDFEPRERIVPIPHTTRRFACRSALAISPDNGTLAFIADLGAGTYSAWTLPLTKPGQPSPALGVDGAALRSLSWSKRGDLIGAADRGGTELHQLYVARSDERVEKLSWNEGERVQRLLSWNATSPDGKRVAFSSNARQPADMDIVIEDVETATERPLVTGPTWYVAGGWSPDGRALLVMRVQANTDQDLFVVDPDSGATRHLTAHEGDVSNVPAGWLADGRPLGMTDAGREHLYLAAYDAQTGAREIIDAPDWDVELAASSADGRAQIWSVNEDGYSTLRWQRDGTRGGERALRGVCEDLIISADGSLAAYHRTSAIDAPQLWVHDLRTGAARAVFETARTVRAADLVEPELIRIKAGDGDIPCFVFRPKDAAGRTPAVLYPHGGPEGQSRPGFPDRMAYLQSLIDRGITLVVPNIHGSTGYGLGWQKAIHRDWGGIDARDAPRGRRLDGGRPAHRPEAPGGLWRLVRRLRHAALRHHDARALEMRRRRVRRRQPRHDDRERPAELAAIPDALDRRPRDRPRQARRALADHAHGQGPLPDARRAGHERPARAEGGVGSGRGAAPRAGRAGRVHGLRGRRPRLHQARELRHRPQTDRRLPDGAARGITRAPATSGARAA
jgi:dipeptidyl aminopeptidase/acylaminoacyl peptidase